MILIDLNSAYGVITVSGPDAEKFLQGQLSADIREINTDNFRLGAFCNLKGRIRALFRILRIHKGGNDQFVLQLPQTLLTPILSELKKYARFSKVVLEDASDEMGRIGIIASQPLDESISKMRELLSQFQELSITPLVIPETPNLIHHYEIMGPKNTTHTFLEWISEQATLARIGNFEEWKLADIRAQIPEIWLETTEKFLPHHLNLPKLGAVSFTKGCYCGQEIIARMQYLGNIKRHMVHEIKASILDNLDGIISSAVNENGEFEVLIEKPI